MSDGEPSSSQDRHARRSWRIAGIGTAVLGPVFALLVAAIGADGHVGLRFFLLGSLAAVAAGSVYAVASGAVDTLRDQPVTRARVTAAVTLGLLSIVLGVAVIGMDP